MIVAGARPVVEAHATRHIGVHHDDGVAVRVHDPGVHGSLLETASKRNGVGSRASRTAANNRSRAADSSESGRTTEMRASGGTTR